MITELDCRLDCTGLLNMTLFNQIDIQRRRFLNEHIEDRIWRDVVVDQWLTIQEAGTIYIDVIME